MSDEAWIDALMKETAEDFVHRFGERFGSISRQQAFAEGMGMCIGAIALMRAHGITGAQIDAELLNVQMELEL